MDILSNSIFDYKIPSSSFIITEINSDMPIYINRTNAGRKNQMPRAGFEPMPRHHDLTKGALATMLPKQPQWSELNISYKGTWITRHLLPNISGRKLLLLIVETKAHRTRCYRSYTLHATWHISNKLFVV